MSKNFLSDVEKDMLQILHDANAGEEIRKNHLPDTWLFHPRKLMDQKTGWQQSMLHWLHDGSQLRGQRTVCFVCEEVAKSIWARPSKVRELWHNRGFYPQSAWFNLFWVLCITSSSLLLHAKHQVLYSSEFGFECARVHNNPSHSWLMECIP